MEQWLTEHRWLAGATGQPVVLDTDTDNEIDDHFAVAWALASDLDVVALHAAPFANERSSDAAAGMRQSAEQLRRLTAAAGRDIPVYDGSAGYLSDNPPARPASVEDLLSRAAAEPITVIAIGAITNIALALRADPSVASRLTVVWLGGQLPSSWDEREFNLSSDPVASREVLESDVDILLVPCRGVAELLQTTIAEMATHLGSSAMAEHLLAVLREQVDPTPGAGRPIWDMAAVACLLAPRAVRVSDTEIPRLDENARWIPGTVNRSIPIVQWVDRNRIFTDFFSRLKR